jgi:hypothetical protein
LLKQLQQLKSVAALHPTHFRTPSISVVFGRGDQVLDPIVHKAIEELGVNVEIIDITSPPPTPRPLISLRGLYTETLLLDVTSMIGLCSGLCFPETIINHTNFDNRPLQLQLEEERKERLIFDLFLPLFVGRKLVTVQVSILYFLTK